MTKSTISSSLAEKREMFIKLQKEKEVIKNDRMTPHERKGKIPVSYIQEGTLMPVINREYDPEETRSPGPALGYIIKGRVNNAAFKKAIQKIVRRHEILRTSYEVVEGQPYQVINDVPDHILSVVDLNNLSEAEKKDDVNRIAINRAAEPFSFFNDKLMITATLITAKDEHVLYIPTHHIATDALSMGVLQRELLTLYQAYSLNIPVTLPELPIQYADYAIWEREKFSGDFLENKLSYWRKLSDINISLPVDHQSTSVSYDGDSVPIVILPELTRRLKLLSQECSVTLFATMFAAFMTSMHIFSGHKHNFFSMPVANRTQKETESMIGCFMNFQFIRMDFEANPTFIEIVKRTHNTLLDVYDNYVPFNFISTAIPPQGPTVDFQLNSFSDGGAGNTIPTQNKKDIESEAQTSISKGMGSDPMSHGMMFIPLRIPQPTFALFPIDVDLSEIADTINGSFKYNTSFYNRTTIVNLTNDYVVLLSQVIKNPNIRISEMSMKPHKSVVKDKKGE